MFPNPSSGIVNIETQEELTAITLYSISGKQLLHTTQLMKQIDISNLATGVYILRMTSKNGVVEKKIVKE